MRRISVIQPSYIPWKGYFDIVHESDVFVLLDDVQYSKFNWRNRNRIKTPGTGSQWLTIPIVGGHDQLIADVKVNERINWRRKHLAAIRQSYAKAPYFDALYPDLERTIQSAGESLSALDIELTKLLARHLGIDVEWVVASELDVSGIKTDRLLSIMHALDGTEYRSGPAAKDYIDVSRFEAAGMSVVWHDYAGYPEYPQISTPFEHQVSVIDLLFMTGPDAPSYIWGERRERGSA